jgi:hypothetical protein
LEVSAADKKLLAQRPKSIIIKTGDGRSVAAHAAVAPASLRSASATAAETLSMAMVPPYSRSNTV